MLNTMRTFLRLLQSRKRKLYTSLALSFLDGFFIVVPLLVAFKFIGSIPEVVPNTPTPLTSAMVWQYTAVMLVCVLVRIVLRYLTMRLRSGAGYEVLCDERKRLGRELRSVSMGYFSRKNLGDLVSTITADAALIEIEGMGVVEKVAIGIPSIVIGLGMLLWFDWRVALAAALLLIPAYFAYRWLYGIQDRLDNRQEQVGEVTEEVVDYIKGLHVLKTYNMESKQFSRTRAAFARLRKLSVAIELTHIPPLAVFQFCFRVLTAVIILLAGVFAVTGQITYPDAFLLMLGSFSFFAGAEMMGVWQIFGRLSQAAIDRMDHIKDVPKMDDACVAEQPGPYGISFAHVNFAYEQKPVLRDVSFTVPQGTMTALVGMSGSGKTTITNLVARFWDVQQGRVAIGDKNVRELDYEALLKSLSFVFQDVFLFNDTVLNNIRIGKPKATMDEVVRAAKRACCHDFITALPNGYDTMVGEGGGTLSGGEKQRISIARALLKDAPIVLLDEVTANVDVENEHQIQMALQALLKGRTVIMIAHKLSTVRHVDQILVLEDGRITQQGTHDELIARDGLYRHLWEMQNQTSSWRL